LNSHHTDSDRFVWRRAGSCLNYNGAFVAGEKPHCAEEGLIEIAGYAYDNGAEPFAGQNQGRLLKIFKTKVRVENWYGFRMKISLLNTVYDLLSEDGSAILETLTIDHRDCGAAYYNRGTILDLYFGGQCPAPQEVSVCFKKVTMQ